MTADSKETCTATRNDHLVQYLLFSAVIHLTLITGNFITANFIAI